MTAWFVVAAPFCLLAKCGVDFITLEYGGKFEIISDGQLSFCFMLLCLYAVGVDFINLTQTFKRGA